MKILVIASLLLTMSGCRNDKESTYGIKDAQESTTEGGKCIKTPALKTVEELAAFAKTVKCIDGDLGINPRHDRGTKLVLNFENLESVSGGINFGGGLLKELRMNKLTFVGGDIFISMASYPQTDLDFVDLSNLSRFGGTEISVAWTPKLKPASVLLKDPEIRKKLIFK